LLYSSTDFNILFNHGIFYGRCFEFQLKITRLITTEKVDILVIPEEGLDLDFIKIRRKKRNNSKSLVSK
jgi:hypothetical protein